MTTLSSDAPATTSGRSRVSWGLLLRVTVTSLLAVYLISKVDWRPILETLQHLRWEYWWAALGVYLICQSTSAFRWMTLSRPLGFLAPWPLFQKLYYEGMFFSLCLPGSIGGDVVKAYRLGTTANERFLAAGTVVADRFTGLTALAVIGVTGLLTKFLSLNWQATAGVGISALALAMAAYLVGQWFLRRNSARLQKAPKIGHILAELNIYNHRPRVVFAAIGWSFVVQLTNVAMVWLLGLGIGLDASPTSYFIAVPAVAFASAVPLSINGLGVREGGLAVLMAQDGVTKEMGVALGLLWFSIVMASGLLGGLAFMVDADRHRSVTAVTSREIGVGN